MTQTRLMPVILTIIMALPALISAQDWATYVRFHAEDGFTRYLVFGEIRGLPYCDPCANVYCLCQINSMGTDALLQSNCGTCWSCPSNTYRQFLTDWQDTTWFPIVINTISDETFRFTFEPAESIISIDTLYLVDSMTTPVTIVNMRTDSEYVYHGDRGMVSRVYVLAIGHEETAAVSVSSDQCLKRYSDKSTSILSPYPNPTISSLRINSDEEVTILNVLGQPMRKFQGQTGISDLQPGLYLLRSKTGSGRFIKQ